MKKILLAVICILISSYGYSQIYSSKECIVSFFSEAPLENIEATNKSAKPILNTSNNEIAIKVPINAFIFAKPLMQEHFNENYMESDKYPTGVFKGKINETIDYSKEGTHKVTATGKLNIHGVEKDRTLNGTLTVKKDEIVLHSEFPVKLEDHKIEVPKVVFEKIAEIIAVKLDATLIPYQKK